MSYLRLKGWIVLLAIAVSCLDRAAAQGTGAKEKIQFSAPSNPSGASNLNELGGDQNASKQLKEDFFKSPDLQHSDYLSDPLVPMPFKPLPQGPTMPDKRTWDKMEQRKNRAFQDWNDLTAGPTMEETLGISPDYANGKEKPRLSPMDKFLANTSKQNPLDPERIMANIAAQETRDPLLTNGYTTSPMSAAIPNSDRFLKSLFSNGGEDPDRTGDGDDVTPGLPTKQEQRDQEKRMDEFRRTLPVGAISTTIPGSLDTSTMFKDLIHETQTTDKNSTPGMGALDAMKPYRSILNPAPSIMDPTANAFHPAILDDPTARALGMPNPVVTQVEQHPKPPPTYDPYENIPKRKF
jgi:hypothetical protein